MGKRARALLDNDDSDDEQAVELIVNKEYAARLEHNKRREELHRLKEKHPEVAARLALKEANQAAESLTDGAEETDSESSSEDEDEEEQFDAIFLDVLAKLKKKDSEIYAEDKNFFEDESASEDSGEDERPAKVAKQKPVLLKDVIARQALENGADPTSSEEEEDQDDKAPYVKEQEGLRQAFLEAAASKEAGAEQEDDFGGILKKRKRARAIESVPALDEQQEDMQKLLDDYFGRDESQMQPDDLFLKHYIAKKAWAGSDSEDEAQPEEADDEEDAEHLQAAEAFEAKYNFRFEEPGSAHVTTYPRQIEGLARKPDSKRAAARQRKAERRAQEKERLASEVRRLKTLKRREIEDRLQMVKEQAGNMPSHEALADLLASEDFDEAEYDAHMQRAFGEDFYQVEDAETLEAASSDEEAQMSGEEGGSHVAGFAAARRRLRGPDAAPSTAERSDAEVQRLLEEYYKLDYEDNVAGIPTRFHYKQVPQADFGLTTEDILALSDKDLNQIIGLAKIAPYREDTSSVRPNYGKMNELDVGPLARKARQKERNARQKDKRKIHKGDALPVKLNAADRHREAKARGQQPGISHAEALPAPEGKPRKPSAKPLAAKEAIGAAAGVVGQAPPSVDEAEVARQSRLASYAKPTLHKDPSKHKKRKISALTEQELPSGLTKTQKKNMRRSQKRAEERGAK